MIWPILTGVVKGVVGAFKLSTRAIRGTINISRKAKKAYNNSKRVARDVRGVISKSRTLTNKQSRQNLTTQNKKQGLQRSSYFDK